MKARFFVLILFIGLFFSGVAMRARSEKLETRQLTDNESFLAFCMEAATSESFLQFRKSPLYTIFYEGATFEQGREFLKEIKLRFPEVLKKDVIEKVREVDCVGGPHVYCYGSYGPFSPSTLLNMKIAGELIHHFGEMENLSIVEIGGNGSLCKVLHEILDVEHYTIVNLEEEGRLTRRYLEKLGLSHVQCMAPQEVRCSECDLLLSYGTFSESCMKLQKKYIKNLIPYAQRGYLVGGKIPKRFGVRTLKPRFLFERVRRVCPSVEVLHEHPEMGKHDFVLVWGKG